MFLSDIFGLGPYLGPAGFLFLGLLLLLVSLTPLLLLVLLVLALPLVASVF